MTLSAKTAKDKAPEQQNVYPEHKSLFALEQMSEKANEMTEDEIKACLTELKAIYDEATKPGRTVIARWVDESKRLALRFMFELHQRDGGDFNEFKQIANEFTLSDAASEAGSTLASYDSSGELASVASE